MSRIFWLPAILAALLVFSGCQVPKVRQFPDPPINTPQPVTLREGDILRIAFPGAPNLNTSQQIRRDGNITLPLVGEIRAGGLMPADLETALLKLYSTHLVSKEVSVSVENSNYPVFVNGAVIRPGKIQCDRPMTVLEAVMEAGGFIKEKADLEAVKVIRHEGGQTHNFKVNLKSVLKGEDNKPFYLNPSDIVYVPEKFSWF